MKTKEAPVARTTVKKKNPFKDRNEARHAARLQSLQRQQAAANAARKEGYSGATDQIVLMKKFIIEHLNSRFAFTILKRFDLPITTGKGAEHLATLLKLGHTIADVEIQINWVLDRDPDLKVAIRQDIAAVKQAA